MTQAQLSELSGISRSAIKGYETGRNMPGSRELKELCRVLKVTPTVLLFGSEHPFESDVVSAKEVAGLRLLLSDPEDAKKARARLTMLSDLLSTDEVSSLLNLVQALALARHGLEVVEQRILGADALAGMGVGLIKQVAKAAKGEEAFDPDEVAADLEEFMDRQGHTKKLEKDG